MDRNQDNIKEKVDRYFEAIDVPLGLEKRISSRIDQLAKEEQEVLMHLSHSKKALIKRTLFVAAALVLKKN